jgi:hypothetical protein
MTRSARPCASTTADPAASAASFEPHPWQLALLAGELRFPTWAEQEYAARRSWRHWIAVHELAYALLRGDEVITVGGSREEAEQLHREALASVVASCSRRE